MTRGISQPFFLISILSLPQRKFLPLLAALPASLGPAKSILQPRSPRFLFFGSQRRRTKRCSDTRQLRTNEFRLTAAAYNYHSLLSASFFRGPFLNRAFLHRQLRQGFIAFKPALKNPQLSESGIFTRSAVSSIFSAIILIIQKALFPCTAAAAMIAFPAHVSVSGTASAVVAEQHHQNDDNAQSNRTQAKIPKIFVRWSTLVTSTPEPSRSGME